MRMLFISSAAILTLAGCSSPQAAQDRWADYQTDLAFVAQYQRYTCGARMASCHSHRGRPASVSHHSTAKVVPSPTPQPAATIQVSNDQPPRQISDLTQKINVLEDALKANAAATNQNQSLIVEQIRELKGRLDELQTRPVAQSTPPSQQTQSGIRIPGND